ncbi:MAG: HAMP domain-containing protein [Nitrospiraceae bacterium]|nr:HAMP domain-containing protein [Nitrospiraceae bacterium]
MSPAPPASRTTTRWGLQLKLILSMLLVGVVPLMVGLGLAFWQGSREIQVVSGESFKALAEETARKIDLLMSDEVARTARIAADPSIVRELEQRRDALLGMTEDERHRTVNRLERGWQAKDPATVQTITGSNIAGLIQEYISGAKSEADQLIPQVVRAATKMVYITDVEGNLVAASTTLPPYANKDTAWWAGAFHRGVGQLFIEDVHFDERAQTYVISISLPIMDRIRYGAIGVLHRVIDAKELMSPSISPIRFGKTGHVMLIDHRGIVMSCPILPTGVPLSDAQLIPLVTPLQPGWVSAPSDGHGGQSTSIIGFAPVPETSRAASGDPGKGSWHTFVWQASDELFAPIRHFLTWMAVFSLVAVGLMTSLGYLAANRIVKPVRRLQAAAQSIGRGELRQPIDIQTGDEIQDLADEFNRMNRQLEAAFAGLTDQVTSKTQQVESLLHSTDEILDAVPTPIIMVNHEEQLQYINQVGRTAFQSILDSAQSIPLFDILPVDAAVREHLRKEFRRAGNGEHATTASGEEDAAVTNTARDPLVPLMRAAGPGHRQEIQIGLRRYHYQWFHMAGRNQGEDRIGLVFRDTTDESRLQDQLIQAEKSGSLGTLTAGIGHELNNPLFGILGLGEAIEEEPNLDRVRSYARDIVQHGRRMASIIRDFTGVTARETSDQRQPVHLEQELDRAITTLTDGMDTSELAIQRTYAGDTCVLALPDQLRQAFTNLLTNALHAMKGRGIIGLSTALTDTSVVITISDSGPGIPKQHLSRIFDPFFTTKGQGEGSGLGLTVARRIIKKFGGDIRIESKEGIGTFCIVTFPTIPLLPPTQEASCTESTSGSAPQPSSS